MRSRRSAARIPSAGPRSGAWAGWRSIRGRSTRPRTIRGDRSRKAAPGEYGFGLPSALANRPLTYEEFQSRIRQIVNVSATPGKEELAAAGGEIVEQVIRPTGLLDPVIEIRPVKGQ